MEATTPAKMKIDSIEKISAESLGMVIVDSRVGWGHMMLDHIPRPRIGSVAISDGSRLSARSKAWRA